MADAPQSPKSKPVKMQELGESGTKIFYGIISGEEYNIELTGKLALLAFDQMRRSDASTRAALTAIKMPIKRIQWYVEPASSDPLDQEIATFVQHNLFDILRFRTILTEILTHLDFGYSVHEKVYGFDQVEGKDRIVLKKLAYRKQTSILRWIQSDLTPGITQWTPDGKSIDIPLNKLVVFTNDQEGDNFEGMSVLRAAYKHWYYKDKLYQIDAVGHERQALGTVKIHTPQSPDQKQLKAAEAAARNLRANEQSYLVEPDGWDIGFMDMKAGTLKNIEPSITHHDRQILKSVMAQFLDLGASRASGARAVGDTQSKLFDQSVQAVAETIADTMNLYVIRDLVDLNFNVTDYPKIVPSDVSTDSLTDLAAAITQFTAAGFITPTEEDEAHVRDLVRFPKLPEQTVEEDDSDTADTPKKDVAPTKDKTVMEAHRLHASLNGRLYGDQARAA